MFWSLINSSWLAFLWSIVVFNLNQHRNRRAAVYALLLLCCAPTCETITINATNQNIEEYEYEYVCIKNHSTQCIVYHQQMEWKTFNNQQTKKKQNISFVLFSEFNFKNIVILWWVICWGTEVNKKKASKMWYP